MNREEVLEREFALLKLYTDRVEQALNKLDIAEDLGEANQIHGFVYRHMKLFHKQLTYFQKLFPEEELTQIYSALYLYFLSQQKAFGIDSWRGRVKNNDTLIDIVFGLGTEKKEIQIIYEAIDLLEKSIAIKNTWHAHNQKVVYFLHLGLKQEALDLLQYMCQTFTDPDDYLHSRQLKDRIELGFL
jgi:tetratricopeptide (TPR) repeat protein